MNGFGTLCLGVLCAISALAGSASATERGDFDIVRAASIVGTGEGFGGGDPRYESLRTARRSLQRALDLYLSGVDTDTMCRPRVCPAAGGKGGSKSPGVEQCRLMASLAEAARAECRRFIGAHAAELRRLNDDKRTPFVLGTAPLTVGGRPVAAMTRREARGEIVFHYGTISEMTPRMLGALLGHELGHKVRLPSGKFLDDDSPATPFADARRLLDAIGTALAFYTEEHPVPAQPVPALPQDVPTTVCTLVTDVEAPYLIGLHADATGVVPEAAELERLQGEWRKLIATDAERAVSRQTLAQRMLTGDAARRRELRRLFQRALLREATAEELGLFAAKYTAGETSAQVFASMLGDDEFLSSRALHDPKGFVEGLFREMAARAPDATELTEQLTRLRRIDRPSAAYLLLTQHRDVRERLVDGWYRELLNRPPSDTERETQAERLRGGLAWSQVRASLLAADEYTELQRLRWKPCTRALATQEKAGVKR